MYINLILCLSALYFEIKQQKEKVFTDVYEVRKGTSTISISLKKNVALTGDIRVECFNKQKIKRQVRIRAQYRTSVCFRQTINQ